MSTPKTSIQISKATKEQLDALGGKKDTYDDIIVRLLAVLEAVDKKKPIPGGNPSKQVVF